MVTAFLSHAAGFTGGLVFSEGAIKGDAVFANLVGAFHSTRDSDFSGMDGWGQRCMTDSLWLAAFGDGGVGV